MREKLRILANSARGAYAIQYNGVTGRQTAECRLPDGTIAYQPSRRRGEVTVASHQRLGGSTSVLLPANDDGSGSLYLYDVFQGDAADQCRVVPAEKAVRCPHCGSWTVAGEEDPSRHYDTCESLSVAAK